MEAEIIKNEAHWVEIEINADKALLNWLVEKLNETKGVEFAAHRHDHPLVGAPRLVVRTKGKKAMDVLTQKLEEAEEEVKTFSKAFGQIVKKK